MTATTAIASITLLVLAAAGGIMTSRTLAVTRAYSELAVSTSGNHNDLNTPDWETLKAVNPDVAGWLSIDDIGVSLPVVQVSDARGEAQCLTHDFWGKRNGAGCPYIDSRTAAVTRHILIYGHTTDSPATMFGPLHQLANGAQFEKRGKAMWLTPEGDAYHAEPLMILHVEASYEPVQHFVFKGAKDLQPMLQRLERDAIITSERCADHMGDAERIMTLATCASPRPHERMRLLFVYELIDARQ